LQKAEVMNSEPKSKNRKSMTFEQAIRLALATPRLTHRQIDELKKKNKLKK
jgi:hypothetical protein